MTHKELEQEFVDFQKLMENAIAGLIERIERRATSADLDAWGCETTEASKALIQCIEALTEKEGGTAQILFEHFNEHALKPKDKKTQHKTTHFEISIDMNKVAEKNTLTPPAIKVAEALNDLALRIVQEDLSSGILYTLFNQGGKPVGGAMLVKSTEYREEE